MTAICFVLLSALVVMWVALIRMGQTMQEMEEERDWYKKLAEDSVRKIDEVRRADDG